MTTFHLQTTRWLSVLVPQGTHRILVLSAAVLVLWCFGDHSPAFSVVEESRLRELGTNLDLLGRRFTETLPKKAELVAKDVLGPLSESYAPIVLALAIFIVFVVETVKTLTVLNGLLGFHALRSKLVFQGRKSRGVWLTFLSINLVFLLTTTVLKFSLTDRIGLAFSLTLARSTMVTRALFAMKKPPPRPFSPSPSTQLRLTEASPANMTWALSFT